jgi:glycosyltransferase involved in cell wall biosynthesis
MKILYIINNLSSGGAEKLVKDILLNFKINKPNIRIELLLLNDKNSYYQKEISDSKIKIFSSKIGIYNPLQIFRLVYVFLRGNYDFIHTHLFPTSHFTVIARMLTFFLKTKYIYTEHNSNNKRRNYKYLRLFESVIFYLFNEIIFVSEASKINHFKWVMFYNHSSTFPVIMNGVDLDFYFAAKPYPINEIIGINNVNLKIITMVGRFSEQKDQETLLRSLTNLPKYFHLVLIGEGEKRLFIQKLTDELKLSSRVHFLGFRNDTERIIKSSFITCLSSNWEGLSLFSIEAMASGIPFIGSNVSGIKDIAENYVPLFKKGDSYELEKLILKLDSNKEFYDNVSKKGKERSNYFSLENMTNNYYKVYENFSNGKRE